MTTHLTAVASKDGAGTSIPGGVQFNDTSGSGVGPFNLATVTIDSTGAEVLGTTADAAVSAGAVGSIGAKLRAISRDIVSNVSLAAGSAPIGTVSINPAQVGDMVTGDFTKVTPRVPTGWASDQLVPIKVQAVSSGRTPSRVNAAASTNATSLKASAGNVGEIDVFNVAAYTVFFKLYDKASAPTVGTDTPVFTIPLAAGTGFARSYQFGKFFSTGIAYAITKLQADTDATAVAAGDVTGSIDWI